MSDHDLRAPLFTRCNLNRKGESVSIVEDLKACLAVWGETLRIFGVERSINERDEIQILRSIKEVKDAEFVKMALFGARFESATDGFDPRKHIMLKRYLHPDKIEKFANLGYQEEKKQREARARTGSPLPAHKKLEEWKNGQGG